METSEQRFRALLGDAFADLPAPPSPQSIRARRAPRAPRKRVALVVIGVAVAIVVVGVTMAIRGDGDKRGLDTVGPPPKTLTAQQLVSATVTELAAPPSDLIPGAKLFAIDRGLLLWGIRDPISHQVTAARYSMQDDTWTTLDFPAMARVPNDAASDISVVSTGTELLLLGRENLALDVDTGKWRPLAEMPQPLPSTAFAFWTGREAVMIGGASSPAGTQFVGQAFDPVENKWRPIAAPPQKIRVINSSLTEGMVLWTGTAALVYGLVEGATGPGGGNLTSYFTYEPAKDRWQEAPSLFNGLTPDTPGATDGRTAYWARFNDVIGLALDTGQRIDVAPLFGRKLDERLVVVGNQLVNLDGTTLKVFDPATRKWIEGPPVAGRTAVVDTNDIYVVERAIPKLSRVAPS